MLKVRKREEEREREEEGGGEGERVRKRGGEGGREGRGYDEGTVSIRETGTYYHNGDAVSTLFGWDFFLIETLLFTVRLLVSLCNCLQCLFSLCTSICTSLPLLSPSPAMSNSTKSFMDLWLELYDSEWKGYSEMQSIIEVILLVCILFFYHLFFYFSLLFSSAKDAAMGGSP